MNSIADKIKDKLDRISAQLDKYDIPRTEIFNKCINDKLITNLRNYNLEIDSTSYFLAHQSSIRVMKALTKSQKEDDKEAILQQIEQ